ncbi:MAG: hypothetical protein DCC58_16875 [Chloroflexi bacterium]|nr:MAG: hypothetical protein DCC58_16875 [Chloroflexota bacterium]
MPTPEPRALVAILQQNLSDYRRWTDATLAKAPDRWIFRAAPWTTCTLGWHMGHLAWKLDSYGAAYFGATAHLDADWKRRFYSDTPLDPADAPPLDQLRAVHTATHQRFVTALAQLIDDDLATAHSDWPDGTLLGGILNVIMHEGEHLAGIDAMVWYFQHKATNDRRGN